MAGSPKKVDVLLAGFVFEQSTLNGQEFQAQGFELLGL
jgi:hypothetical protein